MTDISLTETQDQAVNSLEGSLFIAAGAGSGKTGVITRRFVSAIAAGTAQIDEILTITFTKKAAGEMMERIRHLLREQKPKSEVQSKKLEQAYSQIEKAQISTIDSFCSSLLRVHAFAAGVDPAFSTLDEARQQILEQEAFEACLKSFLNEYGTEAAEFISAYDPSLSGELLSSISRVYGQLRSQGRDPVLPQLHSRMAQAEAKLRAGISAARLAGNAVKRPTAPLLKAMEEIELLNQALATDSQIKRMELAGVPKLSVSIVSAKEQFAGLRKHRDFFLNEVRSLMAQRTYFLMRDLLARFAACYDLEKQQLGALDFADVSLKVRDLLAKNKSVRDAVVLRYKLIMVDEFQDTSKVQHEIIQAIAGGNLCLVGDANQSIYAFRDAAVELFQDQKAWAAREGCLLELADNFRSHPQILSFVDHIFRDLLSEDYLRLKAAAGPDGRADDRRVEIIFIDQRRDSVSEGLKKVPAEITGKAEAQLIAARVKELLAGGYIAGDIAVLVRRAKQADIYRDALRALGIESYLSIGKNYYENLELGDAINLLSILINPLDDLALIAVLRSPMAGVSDDALYWIRQSAYDGSGRQLPLSSALKDRQIAGLNDEDNQKLVNFVSGFTRLRRAVPRKSLTWTCRQIINFNDYAAKIAASTGGRQKLANLIKLQDIAADFEEAWGAGLDSFKDLLSRLKKIRVKEGDAPTEEEGVNAVRFLTMHGAKGLEFPVVILPGLSGSVRPNNKEILVVDRDGRRAGIYLKNNSGFDGPAFYYDELLEEKRLQENKEEKRLAYVAMTRAREHLILSGTAPADKPPSAKKKSDPPFDWLRKRLNLCWDRSEALSEIDCLKGINGLTVGLQICDDPEAASGGFDLHSPELEQFGVERPDPGISRMPPPAIWVPKTITATALDTFAMCPRRYFFEERLSHWPFPQSGSGPAGLLDLGLADGRCVKQAPPPGGSGINSAGAGKQDDVSKNKASSISNMQMGTLVHAILQEAPPPLEDTSQLNRPLIEDLAKKVLPGGPTLSDEDMQQAISLVGNLKETEIIFDLNRAAAAGILERELAFSTMLGSTILKGQIDAIIEGKSCTQVIDYKTGSYEGGAETAGSEVHRYQMAAYALAAFKMSPRPVEVVLVFLKSPVKEIRRRFESSQAPSLQSLLLKQIALMENGLFKPLDSFNAYACSQCSGNIYQLCPVPYYRHQ